MNTFSQAPQRLSEPLTFFGKQERHFVFNQRVVVRIRLSGSSQREAPPFIKSNRTLIRACHHQPQFVYSTGVRPGLNCSDKKTSSAGPAVCRRYPHGGQMCPGRIKFIQKSCGNTTREIVLDCHVANPLFAVHICCTRPPLDVRKRCFSGISASKRGRRILKSRQSHCLERWNIVRVDLFKDRHAGCYSRFLTDYSERRKASSLICFKAHDCPHWK
jgi:hypothetical protein